MLDGFFNSIFGGIIDKSPLGGLVLVSFILTLLITVAYKYLTDQELMKSLKQEIKDFQKEMKEFKHDPSKVMELQKKDMEKNMKYMVQSFKPTLFTLIPLIIIFGWLKNVYTVQTVSFIGITSWFWLYIIFSLVFSIVLRKVLKVH